MELDNRSLKALATTIRMLSADAVEQANAGHPGMPMGAADYAALLWAYFLRFDSRDPDWPGRDRFVLSAGHGSMLLYSLLHLFGFDLPLDEIKRFRQWGSKTPGHPEFGATPGVETTTGPLGQGLANGVGMALGAKMMCGRYSTDVLNYRVFGIVSDGDLMEGVASEAASLAGHLALDNLVYIYDQNEISIGGSTNLTFTESVAKRFEAYGWFVQTADGHSFDAMKGCLERAVAEQHRPSIICARTTIGFGSPNKHGSSDVHGAPLGLAELKATKDSLSWPQEPMFFVPPEVAAFCRTRS
jgi:transketolase